MWLRTVKIGNFLRPHVNYVDLTTFHETVLCGLKQLKLETLIGKFKTVSVIEILI